MVYSDSDTIAAVSTPAGSGGIAIIRMSGQDAFTIADKVFSRSRGGVLSAFVTEMGDHTIAHGYIVDDSCGAAEVVDECLITKMAAPRTYTTEDIVEINSHGGIAVVNKTLELLLAAGARAAEPGEFTKRAFLNGRIDLAGAEAVMDIINAKTESGRRAAVAGLSGRLGAEIGDICDNITSAMGGIDVSIDYPEYDFDEEVGEAALNTVNTQLARLKKLSETYSRGRIAKEGVRIVIAGSPNAGKSTLMNAFCGSDRAIVTDVPGTTRDLIEEQISLDGFPVTIIDTAGLRETSDVVEKIGVDRAREALDDADLILYVVDAADPVFSDASLVFPKNRQKIIFVINKTDLVPDVSKVLSHLPEGASVSVISALTGEGLDKLFDEVKQLFKLGAIDFTNENVITTKRHKQLIDDAIGLLEKCIESKEKGLPLDFVSEDLRLAAGKLCEILGKDVSDEVISSIFQRFCVGK